jgi:hypothetical protein
MYPADVAHSTPSSKSASTLDVNSISDFTAPLQYESDSDILSSHSQYADNRNVWVECTVRVLSMAFFLAIVYIVVEK